MGDLLRGDLFTGVVHRQHGLLLLFLQPERNSAALTGIFDCVIQQDGGQAAQPILIAGEHYVFFYFAGECFALLKGDRFKRQHAAPDRIAEI